MSPVRRWTALFALVMLIAPVVYVLSQAPLPRFELTEFRSRVWRPLYWLTDETQLGEPLLRWADLWGVGGECRGLSTLRIYCPRMFNDR